MALCSSLALTAPASFAGSHSSSGSHTSGSHTGGSHTSGSSGSHSSGSHNSGSHNSGSHSSISVQRDANGKIHRSAAAKDEFKRERPCPSTGKSSGACPGYVIDHRVPLKRGGADAPSNMQWQTTAEGKAKDKTE
jgi:hypothetical protein